MKPLALPPPDLNPELRRYLVGVQENISHGGTLSESGSYTSANVGGNDGVIIVPLVSRVYGDILVEGSVEGDNRWYVESTPGDPVERVVVRTKNSAGAFTNGIVVRLSLRRKMER